jgi:hypothetical protein
MARWTTSIACSLPWFKILTLHLWGHPNFTVYATSQWCSGLATSNTVWIWGDLYNTWYFLESGNQHSDMQCPALKLKVTTFMFSLLGGHNSVTQKGNACKIFISCSVVWCSFTFYRFDHAFFICPVFKNQLNLFPYNYWIMGDNYGWRNYKGKVRRPSLFWGILLLRPVADYQLLTYTM